MRVAFFAAVSNTLVADTLERATEVGLRGQRRYRVVTLRGEIVEPSGAMSGGGNKLIKGKIGQQVHAMTLYYNCNIIVA